MEGRAIARPNRHGGGMATVLTSSSPSASMEGRAIARPNTVDCSPGEGDCHVAGGFNGGPGNCPAKPLVKIGAFDLPVCGRLRAVVEA